MRRIEFLALLAWAATIGCQRPTPVPEATSERKTQESETNQDQPPRLELPFEEAVSQESPGNQQLPPDQTMAGVSTARVRADVQKAWSAIVFVRPDGTRQTYSATFDTDLGQFKVLMQPDAAPNHVRNFVALAQAGYYNGLVFEHLISQKDDDGAEVELIEGGCPMGTGEPGAAHLGYWLRPEFSEAIRHEPGTFGAFHDESPESAALRFYVTVTAAPAMDGKFTAFGKVVEGIDVIRTISRQPKIDGTVQPVKPTTIHSVTIESHEVR